MKLQTQFALLLLVTMASPLFAEEHDFTSLFNGKDFTGWEGNFEFFRVEDEAIIAGRLTKPIPRNEFLCTTNDYANFELRLEAKASQVDVNGGIQIRSQRVPNHHEVSGYQVDTGTIAAKTLRRMVQPSIADTAQIPADGTVLIWGYLYDESRRNRFLAIGNQKKLQDILKPTDWNRFIIRCEDRRITISVNDELLVDYIEADDSIPLSGKIALQIHGGPAVEIAYRNIRLKKID